MFFLAPTTGEQNRKKAKAALDNLQQAIEDGELDDRLREFYAGAAAEAGRLTEQAKFEITKQIGELQVQLNTLDREKLKEIIDQIVAVLAASAKISAEKAAELREYLYSVAYPAEKRLMKATKKLKPKVASVK